MTSINIFGSTGTIGSKSLLIINKYFSNIKINLLMANTNYKKLAKQSLLYNPKAICLTDESKYLKLKNELSNSKLKILVSDEIPGYLNNTKSDMSILCVSGYSSLTYINEIISNTKILGIVSKECIIIGGNIIKNLCDKYNTKLYALDSEHFSIQEFFYRNLNFNNNFIKKLFITASGGPFLGKSYKEIKKVKFYDAMKHPKWKMGIKNSIDSATLVNKCLEIIEAHYLFGINYERLDMIIHPESLIHSIIELNNHTSNLNYFYHDMFIPIYNFLTSANESKSNKIFNNKKFDFKKNTSLNFYTPNYRKFPVLQIFDNMDKSMTENIINFNFGNELAVKLFSEDKIRFIDIPRIIEKSLSIKLDFKLNTIENIFIYQNELINKLKIYV